MITIEDVRAWLDEKNVPYEVMVDSATGNDVYIRTFYDGKGSRCGFK